MHAGYDRPAMTDLSELSLNLLQALDALLAEANVTRAAERLGISQPAMSRALAKLRTQLGDDLLVRSAGGLVRTPRAERIRRSLRHGLDALRRALDEDAEFDPARARVSFTVAGNDVVGVRLVPAVLAELRRIAPKVALHLVQLDDADLVTQLEIGGLDLALGVAFADAPGIKRRTLLRDDWICLARAPLPSAGLDLTEYLRRPHALCSPRGEGAGVVDIALEARGVRRDVALRTRFFVTAALAVARTDLLLTMPRRAGEHLADLLGLAVAPPPLELPALELIAAWHERMDAVPAHTWFRRLVFAIADVDAPAARPSLRARPKR